MSVKTDFRETHPLIKRSASATLGLIDNLLLKAAGRLNRLSNRIAATKAMYVDFVPRPSDVFIVTYPRSGTVLMQMLLYQMTTDGNMEFSHITEACPYLERAFTNRRDLEALPPPRIFKTHFLLSMICNGPGKCIYVARDGRDVAVSYYYFHKNGRGFQGTFSEFFDRFLKGDVLYGSWFDHVADGLRYRNNHNVLFLTYDELVSNLEGSIKGVGEFCGFEVPPERIPTILECCGIEFMRAHAEKFSPATEIEWYRKIKERQIMRNDNDRTSVRRRGACGGWKEYLSDQEIIRYDRRLEEKLDRPLWGNLKERAADR